MSKKPSKPPLPKLHDDDEDRHDSGNATIVGKVDPALLRAAGRTRPAIPRPDPKASSVNKAPAPATGPNKPSDPFAKPTAPPPAPAAQEQAAIATPLASPSPFLDLELDLEEAPKAPAKAPPLPPEATKAKKPSSRPKAPEPEPTKKALPMSRDSGEHTVAVRGFVLPKAAIPSASPLGSDFDIPAQKAPPMAPAPPLAAARAPEPALEAPPASSGPSKFPSDITIMAVGGSAAPAAPAAPAASVSSASPPSSQGGAKAVPAAAELGRSTKPTLLVDRVTLLAARAVDKRASIVIAYVDGNTDIDTIAENTGFLPSETLEIVRSLVAKGILSVK